MPKLNIRNRIFLVISVTTLLSVGFISSGDNGINPDQPGLKIHRAAIIPEGQLEQALKFAKELTEYVNKNYPGYNVQVYREVVDEGGKIHWFANFENQEEFEEFNQKLLTDAGFDEILATFKDFLETASFVILHSIY
ncbi:MAG: DUF6039 family protein [Candidatus Aminicenantes bacterium]|nr:DUF6039 family protein [Candidatus Aminicenantes bacterium]